MNAHLEHEQLEQLLPWYANGALAPAERRQVAAHLECCEACRQELAFLGDVRAVLKIAAMRDEPAPTNRREDFHSLPAELQQRIRAQRARRRWMPALAAGFVASVGLGVALAITWLDAPRFRTATSLGPVASDTVRVAITFAPDVSLEELNGLLREHDAVIVGSSENGQQWVLDVPETDTDTEMLLTRLRSSEGIRAAERIPLERESKP